MGGGGGVSGCMRTCQGIYQGPQSYLCHGQHNGEAQRRWYYPCFQKQAQAWRVPLLTRLPDRRHTGDLVRLKSSNG